MALDQQMMVTPAQLVEQGELLTNLNSKFLDQVEALTQYEKELCASWQSKAQQEFDRQFGQDVTKMAEFAKVVEQFAKTLRDTGERYAQTEDTALSLVSQRRS